MQDAEIYATPAHGKQSFVWQWKSKDGRKKSSRHFEFFFDCAQDARQHGYDVQFQRPAGTHPLDAPLSFNLK